MPAVSLADLRLFINENYLAFLCLGALLIVTRAYRNVRLPAAGNLRLIFIVLFLMVLSSCVERWAAVSPDRQPARVAASVIHYILQPFVIWLELIIIIPRYGKHHSLDNFLLSIPVLFNTAVYLAAPFAGTLVFYYDEHYWFHPGPLGYTIYLVIFFYLGLLLIWTIRSLKQNDRRKSIILFFIVISAIVTGILEWLNIASGYTDEVFTLGVFLYYIYLVSVYESQMKARLAARELELSENRMRLMREQIQPHFIFNALHIIKALIRTDSRKAVRGVEDFSDYLQAHLDAITSDALIPFEDELATIEAYVSLALADESKQISVLYNIRESGFRLPALTVEPLVENALRHGVPKGGTVTLSTRSDQDHYLIVVSDDGEGFAHTGTEKEKRRTGVGIQNVRTRLATLCGGTLKIEQGEKGTDVTVVLPKQRTGAGHNTA